jgi:RimJ/RimL family protein N-acetyltransferase
MHLHPLSRPDEPALREMLMRAPTRNLFHLSALVEWGLPPQPDPYAPMWAVGAFRDGSLVGALVALKGTGGIYHTPGDGETLEALGSASLERSLSGGMSLLSGHEDQIGPLLPLLGSARIGPTDYCHFRTLRPNILRLPSGEAPRDYAQPRIATEADMERLIDFYMRGFYSLANLPSRAAWRGRLTEQIRYRTLHIIEDMEGRVVSAAMSSAESAGGAMLGGVATLPELEGRGLSTLCVGALCAYLFRKGMPSISLFYLPDNTKASRVYEKLGFHPDGRWLLSSLGAFGFGG